MNTHIIIVRHAECFGNSEGRLTGITDFEITSKGEKQIIDLALRLQSEDIDAIYSSPLKRAVLTAKGVYDNCEIKEFVLEEGLREIDFGVCDGMLWSQIDRIYPYVRKVWKEENHYPVGLPNQEDYYCCQKRFMKTIDEIVHRHEGKTICIVTHGTVLSGFMCYLHGWPYTEVDKIKMHINTAFSIIEHDGEKFKIEIEAEDGHVCHR